MTVSSQLAAEALEWHLRTMADASAETIEGLCAWLEASPDNLAAYEQVAALDAELETPLQHLAVPPPPYLEDASEPEELGSPVSANDNEPGWGRLGRFAGWGAAAASIAAGLVLFLQLSASPERTLETLPGQPRVTMLADGSEIRMNGGSKLIVGGRDSRTIQLLSGEASFSVHHDEARPFAVMIGDHEIRDVGTRFNVRRDAGGFIVEVAEGRVTLDPDGSALEVAPGEGVVLAGDEARRYPVAVDDVGGWQRRRLSYDAAPIRQIADDLGRMLGVPITVAAEVASQQYTGTIVVPADRTEAIRVIALTLALEARPQGDGYVLTR